MPDQSSQNPWHNCYFIQYSLNEDNTMNIHPKGIRAIQRMQNNKYNTYFYGAERGTKYGIPKLKDTTHWAIVDASDLSNMKIVYANEYPQPRQAPQLARSRKHYIIVRSTDKYIKFYISQFSSVQKMREHFSNER